LRVGRATEAWTVVAETSHLVAVPSVGSLVPGWLLVVPRIHLLSFGAADPPVLRQLVVEVEQIAASWATTFGPLSWFEHGASEPGSAVGCSIDHAHMHLVPTGSTDLLAGAATVLPQLVFEPVVGLAATVAVAADDEPYLYLRTPAGRSWLASGHDIPSQAFRRVIANQQGCPDEFDWKTHSRVDVLRRTLQLAAPRDISV
jgi:diadenosine tetraphosphate (Ap4A) HIT family hydrolase